MNNVDVKWGNGYSETFELNDVCTGSVVEDKYSLLEGSERMNAIINDQFIVAQEMVDGIPIFDEIMNSDFVEGYVKFFSDMLSSLPF